MTKVAATLYARAGDADCVLAERWLRDHDVDVTVRDITVDPSASAVLFGRIGRITVPTVDIGGRLVVGYDPVQLARILPAVLPTDAERVTFGAAVRTVTAELARAAGLPARYGVEVGPIRDGSPAASAGIQTGDIVVTIGAYTIDGEQQFRTAVGARRPGDTMNLGVWRAGSERRVVVRFPSGDDALSAT